MMLSFLEKLAYFAAGGIVACSGITNMPIERCGALVSGRWLYSAVLLGIAVFGFFLKLVFEWRRS